MTKLTVNGAAVEYDGDPSMPLLWYLRDVQGLTGTKFGCGIAQCGACTVHLNGEPRRSCVDADRRRSTAPTSPPSKAQRARRSRPCAPPGSRTTCRSAATASPGRSCRRSGLLSMIPKPSDSDIDLAMTGNVCRCCTYHRIRAAIHDAAGRLEG